MCRSSWRKTHRQQSLPRRPTETATASATSTETHTLIPSETFTLTPEPTLTETITPGETATTTFTPSLLATATATSTPTAESTAEVTDFAEVTELSPFGALSESVTLTRTPLPTISQTPSSTWCRAFDFILDSGADLGWKIGLPANRGRYLAGWVTTTNYEGGGNNTAVQIRNDFDHPQNPSGNATLTFVQVEYDVLNSTAARSILAIADSANFFSEQGGQGTGLVMSWVGNATLVDYLVVQLVADRIPPPPSEPTGSGTIKKITLAGTGTNPFASSNCGVSATATPTATPVVCSVFGCNSGSTPVEYGSNHDGDANAVDLVPIGVTSGQPLYNLLADNLEWPGDNDFALIRGVRSIVGGTVQVLIPSRGCNGCSDVRVRTSTGICYQYKHMIATVSNGATITPLTRIGRVIRASLDSGPGGAGTESHLHIDRYFCNESFIQTSGTVSGNIRSVIPALIIP